jgi:arylsulfatase A-like enzyme
VKADAPPVLVMAWLALAAATLELLYTGGLKLYRSVVYAGADLVWMTPLGYLILFFPLMLAVLVLRRLVPPRHHFRLLLILAMAGIAFSVLSLFWVPLGPLSALLLTSGIVVQTVRGITAHPAGFVALVRRTLPWMLGIILLSWAAITAWSWNRERAGLRGLAAGDGAPSVILLVLDTVRGMSMSLYGYDRQTTPVLDRFATGGVVFDHAYAAAPWTLPSIATMFTGRYPHEHGADWTAPLPDLDRTLAESFRDAGYATAGFVANQNYSSAEVGLDRGFARYEDYTRSLSDMLLSAAPGRFILNNPAFRRTIRFYDTFGRKSADRLNAAFLSWLDGRKGHPFFAYLNYYDAHEPYLPPAPFDTRFGPDTLRDKSLIRHIAPRDAHRIDKESMTQGERAAEQQAYDGAIAYLDSQLGQLFAALDARDLTRRTLVIVTADHGELFGEHNLFSHGNSLYVPQLHVPLLLRGPGLEGGARVAVPVTLRDLARSILDLAGLERAPMPGRSFAGLARASGPLAGGSPLLAKVEPAPNSPASYPVAAGTMWSIVAMPYQLITGGGGIEALYDLVRDPGQQTNLISSADAQPALGLLRATLDSVRRSVPHR